MLGVRLEDLGTSCKTNLCIQRFKVRLETGLNYERLWSAASGLYKPRMGGELARPECRREYKPQELESMEVFLDTSSIEKRKRK